ncbi:MAG: S8 family serine peptidase [Acidobacteria bacterium]|nr:S8 family serine peptidase [Acidobacteriota bacterium]
MNRSRATIVTVAVAGVILAAWAGAASLRERQHRTVILEGTVTALRLPAEVDLEGGVVLRIDPNTEWFGPRIARGDVVRVVGTTGVGSSRTVVRVTRVSVARRAVGRARAQPPLCTQAAAATVGSATSELTGPSAEGPLTGAGVLRSLALESDTALEGVIADVTEDGFSLHTQEDGEYQVVVTEGTVFKGVESLDGLSGGDSVTATGQLDGRVLTASQVELHGDDGGGDGGGEDGGGCGSCDGDVEFDAEGLVTGMLPPDGFSFDDGRTYRVTSSTAYESPLSSYSDLSVGQFLEVKAAYSGAGKYVAVRIELQGEEDDGQGYREIDGTVASVTTTLLSLDDGRNVVLQTTTRFEGDADSALDIRPGWTVQIRALLNTAGDLLARSVRADNPAPPTIKGQEFEPHEALLILVDGADPDVVAARHGAEVTGMIGTFGVLVRWQQELDDELLAAVKADPDVVAVEPNYRFRDPEGSRKRFPVVDRFPIQQKYRGQAAVAQVDLTPALAGADGSGVVVAVMDTGVDPCNPILAGHILAGGLDLIDGDTSPWETRDGIDEDGNGLVDEAAGHGTFVASIVALAAPGAEILPYRVLDDDGGGTAFSLALALADAINRGVDVINLSLTYHARSRVIDLLLQRAQSMGIVVVASAGNDAATTLSFPATDSSVLPVTALNNGGTGLASFANRSPRVPLAAPGENVYGALDEGRFGTWSGTSMAAPFAAAGAALIRSLDPSVSPSVVRQILVQAGVPLVDGAWDGAALDLGAAVSIVAK